MDICLYFQAHQPNRLKRYTFFDIGHQHFYEDDKLNKEVLKKVAQKCYLPANKMMLKLIEKHQGKFKIAYSLSGTLLEQFEHHDPETLKSFQALAETGCVEFLSETFYHSLAFNFSKDEFKKQVALHQEAITSYFNQRPRIFRNTELIYHNDIALEVEKLGYKGIVSEGVDWYLNKRTPNQLFSTPTKKKLPILLRNYKLSDDISFRFNNQDWPEYPLTPSKYAQWLTKEKGDFINLFMDYETIGEHNWKDTGIFDFWKKLPEELIQQDINFKLPSEIIEQYTPQESYNIPHMISWADEERDLSAWIGNTMQNDAIERVYKLESKVLESGDQNLINVWRKLQTSDHFYYMCVKFANDGDVHQYFSPFGSPYDSYIYYMNVLSDLEVSLDSK